MTPELQAELIRWFIGALVGAGSIISAVFWLIIRWFNNRMEQSKADRESARKQEQDEWKAQLDEKSREYDLRYAEFKEDAKTRSELFDLNRAHANSYEMVAHTLEQLRQAFTGRLAENTAQIEVFGGQLQTFGTSNNELIRVVNVASQQVDTLIQRVDEFFNDLLERDEASTLATTKSRQEILAVVRNVQNDVTVLKDIKAELDIIKAKMGRLIDTQPLPQLDDSGNLVTPTDGNPADNSDSTQTDNDIKDRKIG